MECERRLVDSTRFGLTTRSLLPPIVEARICAVKRKAHRKRLLQGCRVWSSIERVCARRQCENGIRRLFVSRHRVLRQLELGA